MLVSISICFMEHIVNQGVLLYCSASIWIMRPTSILLICLMALSIELRAVERNESDTLNQIDSAELKQGYWILYGKDKRLPDYSLDQKVEEGRYVNNRKTGKWIKYFPSGKVQNEITYINSRPNGPARIYFPNGKVKEEGIWKGNKWHSQYKQYNEHGCISYILEERMHIIYTDSTCDSILQRYRIFKHGAHGQISSKILLNHKGEVVDTNSVEDFELSPIEKGIMFRWNGEGRTIKEFNYRKQKVSCPGNNTLYNNAGHISRDGVFNKHCRLMEGKWYRYDRHGELVRIEVYKKGKWLGNAPMPVE